jgi:hypothetical protein
MKHLQLANQGIEGHGGNRMVRVTTSPEICGVQTSRKLFVTYLYTPERPAQPLLSSFASWLRLKCSAWIRAQRSDRACQIMIQNFGQRCGS